MNGTKDEHIGVMQGCLDASIVEGTDDTTTGQLLWAVGRLLAAQMSPEQGVSLMHTAWRLMNCLHMDAMDVAMCCTGEKPVISLDYHKSNVQPKQCHSGHPRQIYPKIMSIGASLQQLRHFSVLPSIAASLLLEEATRPFNGYCIHMQTSWLKMAVSYKLRRFTK